MLRNADAIENMSIVARSFVTRLKAMLNEEDEWIRIQMSAKLLQPCEKLCGEFGALSAKLRHYAHNTPTDKWDSMMSMTRHVYLLSQAKFKDKQAYFEGSDSYEDSDEDWADRLEREPTKTRKRLDKLD